MPVVSRSLSAASKATAIVRPRPTATSRSASARAAAAPPGGGAAGPRRRWAPRRAAGGQGPPAPAGEEPIGVRERRGGRDGRRVVGEHGGDRFGQARPVVRLRPERLGEDREGGEL